MRRLQKRAVAWLDTDIPYITRGGGWTGMSQLIGIAIGLATSYAFANFLPQAAYGTYKYVLAGAALLAIPALSGMNTAVLQAVAQGYDGTVAVALRTRFTWGLLGTVIGVSVSCYYFLHGDVLLGYSFLLAAIVAPIIESLTTAQSLLLGKKRFDIAARQAVLSSVLTATAVILAVAITRDPLWIIAAFFISTLVGRLITYAISRSHVENSRVSKESLSFGVHTSIAGVLAIVANNADIFVLWHSMGPEALALYAFALAAVVPFQSLVKTGINLAHPKFAKQDRATLILSTKRRSRQMFLLLIPIVILSVLILPYLFKLLFPMYLGAVPYAQVMAFSVLFYSEKLYGVALTVARESKALYVISLVSASTRIVFFIVLIPLFGVWGAVAATLLQQVASYITTRIFFSAMSAQQSSPDATPVL